MVRFIALLILAGILCCLAVGMAAADRLITIPTGKTLTTGGIRAEYASSPDSDGKVYWLNAGISRLEVEGARFQDFGPDDVDAVSAQVAVMPETSFTPSLALGVRDIGDETEGKGTLYDGQSLYLAATKSVPVTGGIPVFFQDVRIHGGVGTGSLGGVFFGVEGTLPMGLRVMGEYDTEDINFALTYNLVPTVKARVSSIKGDIYYGALLSTSY